MPPQIARTHRNPNPDAIETVLSPTRSNYSGFEAGGVFNSRLSRRGTGLTEHTVHRPEEEDAESQKRDADVRHAQEFKGWLLLYLAYQSTGVIYGDIGTSPLYVFSSTFSSAPNYDDLLGALSLIIYALTIMVTIKYICIVLSADDEGEGGTFAIFSLLSRYAHIVDRDPREASTVEMKRHHTRDLGSPAKRLRSGIENSRFVKGLLKFIGVLGVSLVMADGVLTPAQSVLGAIQGLEVVDSRITSGTIVGVSCAILVILFVLQPLGTEKLAACFAPIVIVWLSFNAAFGIYNLVKFDHSVLRAFSPYFAGHYLVRNGEEGWRSLGGILLAFTGCEALFADLGAFSKHSIQLSWLVFVFPCLLLAYIGQAAFISVTPAAYSNPFFNCVPPGMFYPSLVVAILAAVVASQALITSTFQLLSQVMKLSYFPQIKLVHTSKVFHGQIYIPWANWLLMIGTVVVTAVYNNTTSLGNAYGVCVILVTFITTCMVSLVALIIWRVNPIFVLPAFLVFAAFDGAFLSAALTKVPTGAWFTLVLALLLSTIFILWRFGKEQQWHAEAEDRFHPSHLVSRNSDGNMALTDAFGGGELTHLRGFAIFFDKSGSMTPTVFIQFLSKFCAAPDVMVFFHLRPLPTPFVDPHLRYTVSATSIPNCYRLIIRHGYMDEVISEDLALLVYQQVRDFVIHRAARSRPIDLSSHPMTAEFEPKTDAEFEPKTDAGADANTDADAEAQQELKSERTKPAKHVTIVAHPREAERESRSRSDSSASAFLPSDVDDVAAQLDKLEQAYAVQVLYIMGKEQMRIRESTSILRRIPLGAFLWIRENTRGKMAALKIPTDQLVEVGFVKEI